MLSSYCLVRPLRRRRLQGCLIKRYVTLIYPQPNRTWRDAEILMAKLTITGTAGAIVRILHLGRESRRLLWPPSALDREAQLSSCMVSEQTVPTIPRPWEYLCSMKLRVHLHGSILLPFASSQPSIRAACGAGLRTRRNGRTPKGETGRSDAASGCSQISMEKLTSPIYMVFTGLPPGLDILPPILKLGECSPCIDLCSDIEIDIFTFSHDKPRTCNP